MPYASNSPKDQTILRLQARKSYALSLFLMDANRNPLDLTGCTISMVVRKSVPSTVTDDSGNLIVNSMAKMVQPVMGWMRFELQASDLDFKAGEYIYTMTLIYNGFSTVIVQGPLELEQNTEFTSVGSSYVLDQAMSTALGVVLWENQAIEVTTGPTLAPGQALFTTADEKKLDELYAGALAEGTTLNADLIPDGVNKVIMTMAERNKLANLTLNWSDIQGKPAFGTASLQDTTAFLPASGIDASKVISGVLNNGRVPLVAQLRGISDGTAAPASGNPFTLYLKHS